jgi:hypothetical protein
MFRPTSILFKRYKIYEKQNSMSRKKPVKMGLKSSVGTSDKKL